MTVLLLDHPDLDGLTLGGLPAREAMARKLGVAFPSWVEREAPLPDGAIVLVEGRALALTAAGLQRFLEGEQTLLVDEEAGEVLAIRHAGGATSAAGAWRTAHGPSLAVSCPGGVVVDAWERSQAERAWQRERVEAWGRRGVHFEDPERVTIDATVTLAPGCRIGTATTLRGDTRVAEGARVLAGAWLQDTRVGPWAVIKPYSVCEGALVGPGAQVGPMAHLRAGSDLGKNVKVGNFVEVKKTRLDAGAKASHLTYLGDAHVGAEANVGAGTITCNYDGFRKQQTHIGARAFVGSNTALIAPVKVGEGAIIGAGSTITHDVPADALAVERASTRTLERYASRLNARNAAAAKRNQHG